jgi:hypothetical protein
VFDCMCRYMLMMMSWQRSGGSPGKTDMVMDLVCCRWGECATYCLIPVVCRKHGHNEIDDPLFTQPLMCGAMSAVISTNSRSSLCYAVLASWQE